MRTPLWESSTGALAALLNAGGPLQKADLFTLTLQGGTTYRWSGSDMAITGVGAGAGHTWVLGPGLRRTRVRFTVGVEVDSLTLTITDNLATTINGQGLMAFVRAGGLYGARLQLDKAFWGPDDTAPVGALLWFTGRVADTVVTRHSARLTVKSPLELLDVMVPRELYQAGCLNTLYDSACGLSRASLAASGTATSATNSLRTSFSHAMGQAAGYFDLGVITFTSGANTGISRTVKTHTAGTITALQPWGFAVAPGDTFTITPGCDKAQATCTTKFSNLARFRGMPYVPVPETVT